MKYTFLSLSLLLLITFQVQSQVIPRMDSIRVIENGNLLRNPDAGGFNVPEFSAVDLDGDGNKDLFVFDRAGRKVITFLNGGTPNQIDYDFAPQFADDFPQGISDFALCADFDCDDKADLFFGTNDGIRVYRNTSTPGNLSFQLYRDTLFTDYGAGPALIYIIQGDIPAIADIDFDGDLDILAYNAGGTVVEWHKNMVKENTGSCAGLEMVVADRCWGHFQESGLNQNLTLHISCRAAPENPIPSRPTLHSGSTIAAFDEEGDGDMELVIGDLLYDGLTYTHNAGTNVAADVDSIDIAFPSYDVSVAQDIFPAGYFLDVDNDDKLDMLAAPNGTNVSINYDNSWFFKNIAPGNGVLLQREKKNFLTEEMIDAGMCAYPAFFDYNGDGLMDLLVGNYSRKVTATNLRSTLVLYENTGTPTAPEFTLVDRNYANIPGLLTPAPLGLVPAFGDMDGDGDQDMILGDIDGKLHYLQNTAALGQVAIFSSAIQNYMGIDVGQFAAPTIADIDRDGKSDLVVGKLTGALSYYHNNGTAQLAAFSVNPDDAAWGAVDVEPICCVGWSVPFIFTNPGNGRYDLIVGSEKGDLQYFKDFESELGGAFTLDQANFGEIKEGGRTAISGMDLSGDGIWEWLVGNVRGGIGFYSGNGLVTVSQQPVVPHKIAWEVYPNPTQGLLTVRAAKGATGEMVLQIIDLQGRSLLQVGNLSAAQPATLDLTELPRGMYFLEMKVNGQFCGVKRVEVMK